MTCIRNGLVMPPDETVTSRDLTKAALCGEPSYVWRAGQERRLRMILSVIGEFLPGRMLENGCGIGVYLDHLKPHVRSIIGLEYDLDRAKKAHQQAPDIVNAAGEGLPFASGEFDAILSHEVLEHVRDDRQTLEEMIRVLKPGGTILIFVPNRGYPFETHGIFWRGHYHFGNIPLVHYLPWRWQKRLVPHVRSYTTGSLQRLISHLPVKVRQRQIIFGAYDNIIYRSHSIGNILRFVLQRLERTPLRLFGLSHFWVIQKI